VFAFHLYARDEDFDLVCGSLPAYLHVLLGDQLERARAILHIRSREEIAYAIGSLDWILREASGVLFEEVTRRLETQDHAFVNRAKVLHVLSRDIDISAQTALPNATWAEYFAAFTLALIGELLYAVKTALAIQSRNGETDTTQRQIDREMEQNQVRLGFGYAIEAMEAIGYAERFQAEDTLRRGLPQDSQRHDQTGGKVRAADYDGFATKCV
jgi:hypothetical protein